MDKKTYWRGKTIAKRGEVTICKDSTPPFFFHFEVKKRDGQMTDVYYCRKKGVMQWSCNTITQKGVGSCVYFKGDQTKPFCSHTLAASILLSQIKKLVKEREPEPSQCLCGSPARDSELRLSLTHQEEHKNVCNE